MIFRLCTAAASVVILAAPVLSQQRNAVPKPVEPSAIVSLSVRGDAAEHYLKVDAVSAEVRSLLKDMAFKAGVTVYLSPSVNGMYTGDLEYMPAEEAIAKVASSTRFRVCRIVLPKDAPVISEESASKVFEALNVLPESASASDIKTKRSVIAGTPAAPDTGDSQVILYIQGRLSPDQERASVEKRNADRLAATAKPQNPLNSAVQAFQRLPIADRRQALRDMQRQMMQSMTPQEQQQMRNQARSQRDRRYQR